MTHVIDKFTGVVTGTAAFGFPINKNNAIF